jgi:serine phosphatase RsbU (regulator of sigma subunit)
MHANVKPIRVARTGAETVPQPWTADLLRMEIEKRRRVEELLVRRNRQMLDDLRLAAQFQRSILPELPDVPYLDMRVRYRPQDEVSGDLYDVMQTREGDIGVLVGDATGHGLTAAFMTMMMHSAVDNLRRDLPTDLTMARLNTLLSERPTGRAITAVFFRVRADGLLTVTHAGHPTLLVIPQRGAVTSFKEGGCALGMFAEEPVPYVMESHCLGAGDILLAYTDGALECRNADGEAFGANRLLGWLRTHKTLPLDALLDGLLDAILKHCDGGSEDDITLLACRYLPGL